MWPARMFARAINYEASLDLGKFKSLSKQAVQFIVYMLVLYVIDFNRNSAETYELWRW